MTTGIQTSRYLARLRDEAGLKQNELAEKVGWSPTVLSRVESGERPVTSKERNLILEAIGTEKALEFKDTAGLEWRYIPKPPLGHPNQSMLWDTDSAIDNIQTLLADPDIKNSFANRLRDMEEGLRDAATLVQRTEHSVAFVGDIGVGKSTSICRVLGLEISNDKPKPDTVLEVGGGGITVCEVHVVQGPEYGLVVEPRSEQEIRREVREFASLLKNPPRASDEAGDELIGTSKEIERAIRNMSGLTKKRRRIIGPDGKPTRKTEDPARQLADEMADADAFVVEILAKMNLASRTKRETWYEPTVAGIEPLAWLKQSFESLNNGRHPEFSIPQRIEVNIPDPILDEKSLSIRLIDTKGIDRNAQRGDIESLFAEPNTVAVLCSRFESTPSPSVQQLLKRAEEGRFERIEYKTAILGLSRYDEALSVKYDDGTPAESTEDGYDLKLEQAKTMLTSIGIPGVSVEFFNALDDDSDRLRTFILGLVKNLRDQHVAVLHEAVTDARALVDNYEQEQTLLVQQEAAKLLKDWVATNATLDLSGAPRVEESLMKSIGSAHPSSLRASVRRNGEWYNLEYSHELNYGARLTAVSVLRSKMDSFHVVENLLENSRFDEAHGLVRQARRVIVTGVEGLYRKCQLAGTEIHARYMKPGTDPWSESDDEWGRGPGYRDRVARHHLKWFEKNNSRYQKAIANLIAQEWSGVINRLSEILNEVLADSAMSVE